MGGADPGSGRLGVTLVTTTYRPDPMGIALYATDMAEHLAAAGHRVEVVTTFPHYPQWRIAEGYRGRRATEHRNGVAITRLWLHVPRAQSAARRAAYEASFVANALTGYRPPRPLDLVISVVPNVGNALVGLRWARRRGARSLLCVQDLSGRGAEEAGVRGGAVVSRLVEGVETRLARRADLVTVCSEGFARTLVREGVDPGRIVHFPNWARLPAPIAGRDEVRARLGWGEHDRVVLHAGNMGMKQGLELVGAYAAHAARRAPGLRFVLVGDGNQRRQVEEMARGVPNVDVLPPVAEGELPGLLAAADVLLVHERPGLREMSVPSKLTAYLATGRPVVAAVDAESGAARVVLDAGAGEIVAPGDAGRLVDALRRLADDPARSQALGERGRDYAERVLSRDAAMARLDEIVAWVTSG